MRLGIAEILENASKLSRDEKIMYLRKNDSVVLRKMLEFAFDKRIQWDLPEGKPPYKPCQFLDQEGMLYTEMKRMYVFLKGGNPELKQRRREELFIGLLESLMPNDAELLCDVKDHIMPYNVPEDVVREAFPDLLLFPYVESKVYDKPEIKATEVKVPKKKDTNFAERMKAAKAKKKLEKEKINNNG